MTDKLKEAIITIAEYDKGWTEMYSQITDVWSYRDAKGISMTCRTGYIPYHYSADALLPVWRKLRDDRWGKSEDSQVWDSELSNIVMLIANDDFPAACELIADIINGLKQKQ